MEGRVRLTRIFFALVVTAYAVSAHAESDRNFLIELKFGPYKPSIDSEFDTATPYADVMGSSSVLMSQLEFEYEFWNEVGVIALGCSIGYSKDSGKQKLKTTLEKSNDETTLHLIPLKIDFVYRFDYLAQKYNVPLVPHIKGGFDYYVWWITNSVGHVPKSADGSTGRGGTFGGHVSFGLAFLLDFLTPDMAQTFDTDLGVNNTYIFAEYVLSWIDDFGSDKSFDFSSRTFMAGVAFEF